MNIITKAAKSFSSRAREKRRTIFLSIFSVDENTKILDLGSGNGSHINMVLQGSNVKPENVSIADIDSDALQEGHRIFGFTPVLIDETEPLPFTDSYFDIVYCSSVIEHVTIPKKDVWTMHSGRSFLQESRKRQRLFAQEIERLGKQYFVQTPYRHFPIESHSWLPFLAWFPRWLLIPVLRFTNLVWVKKTSPDWHLLDKSEMSELFQSAKIIDEKVLGMTKSIIAVYRTKAE